MGTKPLKKSGYRQGLYAISATAQEAVGTLRFEKDGRKFRYAKAGASALSAGKMGQAAACVSTVVDQATVATHYVGDTTFTETITAGTAFAENYFKEGFLHINDGTGQGLQYKIEYSSPVTAAGTSITLILSDPIKVATVITTSLFTIVHNPWMATVESATEENVPIGVPTVAVTAAYYYWAQTCGLANVLCAGTPAVGTMLTMGSVAGSLAAINATLDIDQPICARTFGTVGVDTDYKPVMLLVD